MDEGMSREVILPDDPVIPGSTFNPWRVGRGEADTRVVAAEAYWRQPLKWNATAKKAGVRQRVFCDSLADVFEDWAGDVLSASGARLFCDRVCPDKAGWFAEPPQGSFANLRPLTMDDVRRRLFSLIDDTPWLDWILLTKRPENLRRMWPRYSYDACATGDCTHDRQSDCGQDMYRENVWLLASVSDQASADAMAPSLLECRDLVPVPGLSVKPPLGSLDLTRWVFNRRSAIRRAMNGPMALNWDQADSVIDYPLGWVIVGGESGLNARPCDVAGIRSIVAQCKAADVPCFVTQLGSKPFEWVDIDDRPRPVARDRHYWSLRDKKGGDPAEWPEDLRVWQLPEKGSNDG